MEERQRQKSPIEELLISIPSLQELDKESETGEGYRMIRRVERVYEQLQRLGVDVRDELRERRYQILEYAVGILEAFANQIRVYAEDRGKSKEGMDTYPESYGAAVMIEAKVALERIEEYLKKLCPKSEILTFPYNNAIGDEHP